MSKFLILSTHIFKDRKNENYDIWCCQMNTLSAAKNIFNKDDFLALIIAEFHCKSQETKIKVISIIISFKKF